jgi:hypothetical protein
MKFRHLIGGGRALASAAAALIEDESVAQPAAVEEGGEGGAAAAPVAAPDAEDAAAAAAEAEAAEAAAAAKVDATLADIVADLGDPAVITATTEQSIRAEERQRVTDVFASDASNGKERVAASLLADSDMSADKIVALLPKLGADASDAMLANLKQPNPVLGAGAEAAGGQPDPKASWNTTFERLGWNK